MELPPAAGDAVPDAGLAPDPSGGKGFPLPHSYTGMRKYLGNVIF